MVTLQALQAVECLKDIQAPNSQKQHQLKGLKEQSGFFFCFLSFCDQENLHQEVDGYTISLRKMFACFEKRLDFEV